MAGELIARGRAADVYDAGPGRVLRRCRDPEADCTREAAVMRLVADAGYPVPTVLEAAGPDLVLSREDGPTMLEALAHRPWRLGRYAAVLADLHRDLAAIEAPADLRRPFGPGRSLLHLDLHPGNVLLTAAGPVVIDWTNAAGGPAGAGVADTWLLMAAARPDGSPVTRALAAALAVRLAGRFATAADRDAARPFLRAAVERRAADHNMRPAEVDRMRALAAAEP